MYVLIVGISSAVFSFLYISLCMSNSIFDLDTPPPPFRPLSKVSFFFRWCFDRSVSFSYLCIPFFELGVLWVWFFFLSFFENLKKLNSDLHGDAS